MSRSLLQQRATLLWNEAAHLPGQSANRPWKILCASKSQTQVLMKLFAGSSGDIDRKNRLKNTVGGVGEGRRGIELDMEQQTGSK